MFGIFRRCLSQQYEVRARVYRGLTEVAAAVPEARCEPTCIVINLPCSKQLRLTEK